jgi:hypothetical protein
MENCNHENGEQVANLDHGYVRSKDFRSYEVYVCLDCGHLINGAIRQGQVERWHLYPLKVTA